MGYHCLIFQLSLNKLPITVTKSESLRIMGSLNQQLLLQIWLFSVRNWPFFLIRTKTKKQHFLNKLKITKFKLNEILCHLKHSQNCCYNFRFFSHFCHFFSFFFCFLFFTRSKLENFIFLLFLCFFDLFFSSKLFRV